MFGVDDIAIMLGLGVAGAGLSTLGQYLLTPDEPSYPKQPTQAGFNPVQSQRGPTPVVPAPQVGVPSPQFGSQAEALKAYQQALGFYMKAGELA